MFSKSLLTKSSNFKSDGERPSLQCSTSCHFLRTLIIQVCLDICMEAPIIILPVSSRNPFTFEANLGKLTLVNDHRSTPHFAHTILTDVMTFKLSEMTLARLDYLDDNFGLVVG